ncbi:MAG: hypothetical protein R3F59_16695 [Myxococcota bacterium]
MPPADRRAVAAFAALAAVAAALGAVLPLQPDVDFLALWTAARSALHGASPYAADPPFAYPPWTLLALLPLGALPAAPPRPCGSA